MMPWSLKTSSPFIIENKSNQAQEEQIMSNQSIPQSRRNFLKGAAYTSLLSLGGISSLAFATNGAATKDTATSIKSAEVSNSGISVTQQKILDREKVTLINQSNKLVMVDALKPISLKQVNGSLVVKVNQIESEALNGMVAISPSESITFDINAVAADFTNVNSVSMTNLARNHLQITSEHSIFNRVVPVQLA
jgi:hypothetical protein